MSQYALHIIKNMEFLAEHEKHLVLSCKNAEFEMRIRLQGRLHGSVNNIHFTPVLS